MGALYKEQNHGSIIQGATSWEHYTRGNIWEPDTRSNVTATLYKEQRMGKINKKQHRGNM
jgi:hypothetical protein